MATRRKEAIMPGQHRKGTNDADGDGKKGGSLPETDVSKLQKRVDLIVETMKANGWTLPKGLE